MRNGRYVAILAASALAGCGEAGSFETSGRGLGTYSEVTQFGPNPGALKMFKYIPDPAPAANAPLVLALHACSQTASAYRNAGWEAVADDLGFYVVYPQQETGNNPLRCFNWAGEYGDPTNLMRGEGENQSIIEMIEKMKTDHQIDPARVFITGHSGGGAQTALMLATWPEVFAGGAPIAGIPYNCTTSFTEVTTCLNPGIDRTAMQWGDRARDGYSGYSGPFPKLSIWQGSTDSTVNPINAREMLEQWTNVHGVDTTADVSDTVDGYPRAGYQNGSGETVVEVYDLTGMNHGTPVDPSANCGTAGAYFLDAGICAARRIAEFFELDTGSNPGDRTPPVVNITAPADGSNVSGVVNIRAGATDDVGVASVQIWVGAELKTTLTAPPFEYAWNTGTAANGDYLLKAVAADAAGNSATDEDTTVTVTGGVNDTQPPTVNITAPANNAQVSGSVMVTASATDDFSVARVEFLADGAAIGQATSAPFSITWNLAGVAAGTHNLTAVAYDAAGNSATDDDTSVVVEVSAGDTTPPTVSFAGLEDGAAISGIYTVVLEASDDVGVATALLFLDGTSLLGSDYALPFEFLWDTAVNEEGPHTLTARVFDAAGNIGQAEISINIERAAEMPSRVKIGRKYWGCSAAPSASDQVFPLVLVLCGFLFARVRRSPKRGVAPSERGLAPSERGLAPSERGLAAPSERGLAPSWRRGVAGVTPSWRRGVAPLGVVVFLGCAGEEVWVDVDDPSVGRFASGAKISAFLEGKTLTMEGDEIPSHPNGLDEDINFGQATQCYQKVTMSMLSARFHVVSLLGTLMNAPSTGDRGTCDHASMSAELAFDSTAVLIDNVRDNGACFDFTITFPGFGQEGRGSINEAGDQLVLELFFKDRAVGHRCADGDVGADTVVLSQTPFDGNALQTYFVGEGS